MWYWRDCPPSPWCTYAMVSVTAYSEPGPWLLFSGCVVSSVTTKCKGVFWSGFGESFQALLPFNSVTSSLLRLEHWWKCKWNAGRLLWELLLVHGDLNCLSRRLKYLALEVTLTLLSPFLLLLWVCAWELKLCILHQDLVKVSSSDKFPVRCPVFLIIC